MAPEPLEGEPTDGGDLDGASDELPEEDGQVIVGEDRDALARDAPTSDRDDPGADAGAQRDEDAQAPDEIGDAALPDAALPDAALPEELDAAPSSDAGYADAAAIADAGGGPCVWSEFEAPEEITGLQLTGELWGPALSADRRTLYFAENDGTDERIMQATRSDLGPNFSPAIEVPNIQSTAYDGTPFVSVDGLSLYMYSLRGGGPGDRDLWIARRNTPTGSFAAPTLVPGVNSAAADLLPRLSRDSLTLIFSSGRVTNPGNTDIWQARRSSVNSTFGNPTLVSELSTSAYESSASLSSDGLTVVFASDRAGGVGDKDLWIATRADSSGRFGAPRNLTIANSASSDSDCVLSADDHEVIFSSGRSGTRKLWRVVQTCR